MCLCLHMHVTREEPEISIFIAMTLFCLSSFFLHICNPSASVSYRMNQLLCSCYYYFFLSRSFFLDGKQASEWLGRNERIDGCEQKESNEWIVSVFFSCYTHDSYMHTIDQIYIYKEESLFVCLFFMHSVPVSASATKLCMPHPIILGEVKRGSAPPRGGWEGFCPRVLKNRKNFFRNF
jgi:hypothetical protein